MEEKNYRLIVSNYYEWKNFKGKGMSVTVICDGKKEGCYPRRRIRKAWETYQEAKRYCVW